ncbi:Hpt domain-containing protein [Nitratifractor salsuginis]|uniref:Hpt domain protein n=1 Tax=Nitratifractor salsuginis (strain DSM 16511 / JCM 12458 / E9I37-1) TaxID=749222 RepID=E6X0A0_NITSE|nr:Hpt domain-containing protein [Nitratifractor salsuginis]ADV45689.1 Hpt domain protein [Nitratifractor salsuginis DSM 16511]
MFIIDQNNHLIAANQGELKEWGYTDFYEAARAFANGSVRLSSEQPSLILEDGRTLSYEEENLDSALGIWRLFRTEIRKSLEAEPAIEAASTETPSPIEEAGEEVDEELEALLELLTEEGESPSSKTSENTKTSTEPEIEELLPLQEETPTEEEVLQPEIQEPATLLNEEPATAEEEPLIELQLEEELPTEEETQAPLLKEEPLEVEQEEEPLLELIEEESFPLELEKAAPQEVTPLIEEGEGNKPPVPEEAEWEKITKEFHPDLKANAAQLNLGSEEYLGLLRDLTLDLKQMREQLLNDDSQQRHEAVSILKDALLLLQLSPLDRMLSLLEQAEPEDRTAIVDSLENLLDSLAASHPVTPETPETVSESQTEIAAQESPTPQAPIEEVEKPEEKVPEAPKPQVSVEAFLEGVEPIPISFSLHVAAEELNLPEDLVQEFVTDFAQQGHDYLPVLIEAYKEKDLDKLQKTAHMLKGAASNLRVEAMVENLYELQFDNDIERAPERIRKFAGQLMSLDNFLKQLNE